MAKHTKREVLIEAESMRMMAFVCTSAADKDHRAAVEVDMVILGEYGKEERDADKIEMLKRDRDHLLIVADQKRRKAKSYLRKQKWFLLKERWMRD